MNIVNLRDAKYLWVVFPVNGTSSQRLEEYKSPSLSMFGCCFLSMFGFLKFLPSDVERLTNKQLRLYLRQEGLMVSGNKAQLVERILEHADGSVARTFDEDIEDDDENMPSVLMMIPPVKYEGGSQPSMKVVHQATIMWSAASKFYLLMMQTY